jgi:rubredoxin
MWQCDNCGYTDEDGATFEEEPKGSTPDAVVRYCPECGSDEVYAVEEDEEDLDDEEDDDDDDEEDWDEDFEEEEEENEEEW